MNPRLARLAAITAIGAGTFLAVPAIAGATPSLPDGKASVPAGCGPVVSFQHPTVSLAGECAPLTLTVVVDNHDAATEAERLSATTVTVMNGDPLPLPLFTGCDELQLDLFQGAWTPEMLRSLEDSGTSPGAWLWTAALVSPVGRDVPAAWKNTNAVIKVAAGDCTPEATTTTTATPTSTTITEFPPAVDVPLDAPTTTAPAPTTTAPITYVSTSTPLPVVTITELPFTGAKRARQLGITGLSVIASGLGLLAWSRRQVRPATIKR